MNPTLEFNLKQLRLKAFLHNYKSEAEAGIKKKASYFSYLETLSQLEITRRDNALIQTRLRQADFPYVKTLDTFDYTHVPDLSKHMVCQLAEGHFTTSAKNLIFFGPCGGGKTHLAIALGRELCFKKYRVYFNTVTKFISVLQSANRDLGLHKFFKKMKKWDLIILDEFGFVPFERQDTNLLFQFLSEQYEKRSLLITTNLAFTQWDQIFKDTQITVAAVDRLIHHSHIVKFEVNESYRNMIHKREQLHNSITKKVKKDTSSKSRGKGRN
ncbi:MAG: IS21-like element helper ATPase IstB [Proteobacteria bacterium]|nr:IS21-like element helper ATPase IstB [Pseudomonadota bacterium]